MWEICNGYLVLFNYLIYLFLKYTLINTLLQMGFPTIVSNIRACNDFLVGARDVLSSNCPHLL